MFGKKKEEKPEEIKKEEEKPVAPPPPPEPIIEAKRTTKIIEFTGSISHPDEKVLFARCDNGKIYWRTPDRGKWIELCDDEIEV